MTMSDAIKREVDLKVWCDSVEWKGDRQVTFRRGLAEIPADDITGSKVVKLWQGNLLEVKPPIRNLRVQFKLKTYGCIRCKDEKLRTGSVASWTHCFATFELVFG